MIILTMIILTIEIRSPNNDYPPTKEQKTMIKIKNDYPNNDYPNN